MKKIILVLSILVICMYSCKKATKKSVKNNADRVIAAVIDSICQSYIDKGNTVGFSVAITKKNKLFFSKGYGLANIDSQKPATDSTVYAIASVSKFISSVAALKLVDQGKLNLTDKVIDLLPDFPRQKGMEKITIDHLMRHQSGLVDHEHWADSLFINEKIIFDRKSFLAFIDQPLLFEPGTNFLYSNSGFNTLKYIVEQSSGLSFEDFIAKEIAESLGATSLNLWPLNWSNHNASMGYELVDKKIDTSFHMMTQGWSADGGLSASVKDLVAFIDAFADGKIVSEKIKTHLLSPTSIASISIDYGNGTRMGMIDGKTTYGHTGGYSGTSWAQLQHVEEEDISIAVAMNTSFSPDDALTIKSKLLEIMLDIKFPKMENPSISGTQQYIGTYQSPDRWGGANSSQRVISEKNRGLLYDNPATKTPGAQLFPIRKHVFGWKEYTNDEFRFHMQNRKAVALSNYIDGMFMNVRLKSD